MNTRNVPPLDLEELRLRHGLHYASILYVEDRFGGPHVLFENHPEAEVGRGVLHLDCLGVHRIFRRRGIARNLTEMALEVRIFLLTIGIWNCAASVTFAFSKYRWYSSPFHAPQNHKNDRFFLNKNKVIH